MAIHWFFMKNTFDRLFGFSKHLGSEQIVFPEVLEGPEAFRNVWEAGRIQILEDLSRSPGNSVEAVRAPGGPKKG